jgi:heterodisulfide reductase subunit B
MLEDLTEAQNARLLLFKAVMRGRAVRCSCPGCRYVFSDLAVLLTLRPAYVGVKNGLSEFECESHHGTMLV